MATIDFLTANRVRVYKDGNYLNTLTDVSLDATQNTVDRQFVGDEEIYTISTTKEFGGTFNRAMINEEFIETIQQDITTTKFTASDYDDYPNAIKTTLNQAGGQVDLTFTTPATGTLTLDSVTLNVQRVGSFEGGLAVEIWEGVAGVGTLKGTLTFMEGELPSTPEFITLSDGPEAGTGAEFALVANTSHQMRIKKAGTVTGSLRLYGPTAASTAYYALVYETTVAGQGDYIIDIVFADKDLVEAFTARDTGITFLSNGMTINPNEPIGETLTWRAKKRTIV